jgi:hypothetical protein
VVVVLAGLVVEGDSAVVVGARAGDAIRGSGNRQ